MDVLRQLCACERLPNRVIADVGDLAQAVEQAKRLKYARINSDADISVPGLDLLEGRAGRKGALSYDRHW